ncbi:alkanesulfonate monooxygenase SsuD/methylene tetrahydromethanopterin reductase-like flavin-dependent oxidoreductase (luciferase family) [Amycolatopsis bartoniae]|nr:LLM class flavin-dependent oxidoreductase [Amycolatopsis bartoniae]MBB2937339.1 alkanesulfonate monooxygenase SsuD/methylene tetrahydromethanopterin reductase-like flavin-dependent oxidoreductase (luciferase family) [Amycolatopsis bartoniae]TVT07972.1 LLM class flavin-dependent oxidoreductase [Amycolatopsis bartoniae]
MDFGLNFFPVMEPGRKSARDYYDETLRLSRLAEERGFEHVQTVEHYGSGYGGYSPDPVTLLTAVAAVTDRIRITTGAVIPAFTHPLKLAGKLAMLDNLSGGRLDVGFGRGFLPDEFDWFGVPMAESRERFDEGIEACRRLWSEENVVFSGKFSSFGPVTLQPRTVQQPHPPIFVASATSPESCAAAGTAGYHLQVVPSVTSREQLSEMLAAYREAWAAAGHAEGGARIQIKYTCYVAEDGGHALALAERFETNYIEQMTGAIAAWATTRSAAYPGYEGFIDKVKQYDFEKSLRQNKVFAGTPEAVAEQVATIGEWFGTDLCVSLQFSPGYQDFEDSHRALTLFADRVMPRFRH